VHLLSGASFDHTEERTIGRDAPEKDWLTPLFGPERFHPVHDTMPLPGPQAYFTDYVDRLRTALDRATGGALPADILENRLPFQWGPEGFDASSAGERFDGLGVLLVHGLMDCPFIMRDLASRFRDAGHVVQSVLLPGHGITPGALLTARYTDWVEAVQASIDTLAARVTKGIVICGYSLGTALAVERILAQGDNGPIRGLIAVAPGLRAANNTIALSCPAAKLAWAVPKLAWVFRHDDLDYYKYESMASNAACQFYRLSKGLGDPADGPVLQVPVFMAVSADDGTIDASAAKEFLLHRTPIGSRLLWYASDQPPAPPKRVNGRSVETRSPRHQDDHVAGISHVALPVDGRNNPHYGHGGAYRYTPHYKLAADRRRALLKADPDGLLYGEISVNHMTLAKSLGRPLCRLTYNPDFDGMATAMTVFVAELD